MMRLVLIVSTIVALLGCPLRCGVGEVWNISTALGESSGNLRSSGCSCCAHRSNETASEIEVPNWCDSDCPPTSPGPSDCDCLCLCKGAIVEKHADLPLQDHLGELLPPFIVDHPITVLHDLTTASSQDHRPKPSGPSSGRLLRLAVQSLVI